MSEHLQWLEMWEILTKQQRMSSLEFLEAHGYHKAKTVNTNWIAQEEYQA